MATETAQNVKGGTTTPDLCLVQATRFNSRACGLHCIGYIRAVNNNLCPTYVGFRSKVTTTGSAPRMINTKVTTELLSLVLYASQVPKYK